MSQTFITPCTFQIYLHQTIFCFPSWKWSYKDSTLQMLLSIQEAVTDELKKVQKEEFFISFSETVRPRKSLYICQWSLFWIKKKKGMRLPHVSSVFKKISPKTFGPHCTSFRLSMLLWFGSCIHCLLACLFWCKNSESSSSNNGLCCFCSYSPRLSLAEILIFLFI